LAGQDGTSFSECSSARGAWALPSEARVATFGTYVGPARVPATRDTCGVLLAGEVRLTVELVRDPATATYNADDTLDIFNKGTSLGLLRVRGRVVINELPWYSAALYLRAAVLCGLQDSLSNPDFPYFIGVVCEAAVEWAAAKDLEMSQKHEGRQRRQVHPH